MAYYLDTDILVDILRGHPPAVDWLRSIADEEIILSAFVVMELLDGSQNKNHLRQLEKFLRPYPIDWPEEEVFRKAIATFGRARLSHGVGVIDTLIACMAMARGLPLYTGNVRHYAGIPGLETIQPYTKGKSDLDFQFERMTAEVAEQVNERDGSVLVYVPGGEYTLGADDVYEDSRPVHTVVLSPFWIGKYAVTNAQYRRYLEANPDRPQPEYWDDNKFNQPEQPVVGVSWEEARAYCNWAGLELPSEAQWEAAARGQDQRRYPWGNEEPSAKLANFDELEGATTRVGAYSAGAGPFGALDQAGNVWEWCVDLWGDNAYTKRDGQRDPVHTSGDDAVRVLRGGSWANPSWYLHAAFRGRLGAVDRNQSIGFRCVLGFRPEP